MRDKMKNGYFMKLNRQMPRRLRRGFSIAEMALVLVISAFIMQTAIEVATAHTKRQLTQRTAAHISTVADDVQTYMDRNYFALVAETATRGGVMERNWSDLIDGNLISQGTTPISPDRGDLRLFFTLRGDTLYSVIMSFDGAATGNSPRPDPNTQFAGKVQGNGSTLLNGWDFQLDIPEIAALTGESLNGNIGVMRYVAVDVNIDPYLHRVAVPGRPDLNRMEADLDLGGFNIDNTANITTNDLLVQDNFAVDGRLLAAEIETTGDAIIQEVRATTVVTDELTAQNASLSGTLTTNLAVVGGLTARVISGQDASFNNLSTERLEGGTTSIRSAEYIQINAVNVNAEQVIADQIFIGD